MQQIALEFWENFRHNLFKPLLLFFYMGFLGLTFSYNVTIGIPV